MCGPVSLLQDPATGLRAIVFVASEPRGLIGAITTRINFPPGGDGGKSGTGAFLRGRRGRRQNRADISGSVRAARPVILVVDLAVVTTVRISLVVLLFEGTINHRIKLGGAIRVPLDSSENNLDVPAFLRQAGKRREERAVRIGGVNLLSGSVALADDPRVVIVTGRGIPQNNEACQPHSQETSHPVVCRGSRTATLFHRSPTRFSPSPPGTKTGTSPARFDPSSRGCLVAL